MKGMSHDVKRAPCFHHNHDCARHRCSPDDAHMYSGGKQRHQKNLHITNDHKD